MNLGVMNKLMDHFSDKKVNLRHKKKNTTQVLLRERQSHIWSPHRCPHSTLTVWQGGGAHTSGGRRLSPARLQSSCTAGLPPGGGHPPGLWGRGGGRNVQEGGPTHQDGATQGGMQKRTALKTQEFPQIRTDHP